MIYDWRLVAPASSPFDNYPKKKIKRREQRERTGYKAMECVFGNGYAPMDG